MIEKLVLIALSAGLAFGATAPKPAAATPTSNSASKSAQKGPQASDQQIDATIRAKLAKSKIGADHFKFRVAGGVVYWEGTTNVIQHKGSATRMAKSSGARAVVNNIQISDAARAKARAQLEGRSGDGDEGPRRATVKTSGDAARAK